VDESALAPTKAIQTQPSKSCSVPGRVIAILIVVVYQICGKVIINTSQKEVEANKKLEGLRNYMTYPGVNTNSTFWPARLPPQEAKEWGKLLWRLLRV
jgi:hypothetical protein